MRVVSYFFVFWAFLGVSSLFSQTNKLPLTCKAAIVMDAKTGAILFQKDAYIPIFPASVTKIATCLYALELAKDHLQQEVVATQNAIGTITSAQRVKSHYRCPPYWIEVGGTHMVIHVGEKLTLDQLFHGLMLISANDAANVIAEHFAPSIPEFMQGMNRYLKKIGCRNTHFLNPHGIYHPQHQTTAYDLALMMQQALKKPYFRHLIHRRHYHMPSTNKSRARHLINANKLLNPKSVYYLPGTIGGKSGTYSIGGLSFASAAQKNGKEVIVVVLHCSSSKIKFEESIQLYQYAFSLDSKSKPQNSAQSSLASAPRVTKK